MIVDLSGGLLYLPTYLSKSLVSIDTVNGLYYGYGQEIGKNQFGNFITHSGGWPGYRTIITRYLQNDITIIILSNNDTLYNTKNK